jgi:hypothetical protein
LLLLFVLQSMFISFAVWMLLHPPAGQSRRTIVIFDVASEYGACDCWLLRGASAPSEGSMAPPLTDADVTYNRGLSATVMAELRNPLTQLFVDFAPPPEPCRVETSVGPLFDGNGIRAFTVVVATLNGPCTESWAMRKWTKLWVCDHRFLPVWSLKDAEQAHYFTAGSAAEMQGSLVANEQRRGLLYHEDGLSQEELANRFDHLGGRIRADV